MWSISLLQSWWRMLRNISISHWKTSKRINIKYENRTTQLKVRDLKYECITSCGDISLKYKNDSTTNKWKHSQLTIFVTTYLLCSIMLKAIWKQIGVLSPLTRNQQLCKVWYIVHRRFQSRLLKCLFIIRSKSQIKWIR
jgi:hypothetical protein